MISRIYQGEVKHHRKHPIQHKFHYSVCFFSFDVDELAALSERIPLFGYNQFRPVAIRDRDFLSPGEGSIREKLNSVLQLIGMPQHPHKVILVTSALYFNYAFNPISFFYCYDCDQKLTCVLMQVNNTFGEMHLYHYLPESLPERNTARIQFTCGKEFHVSPFMKGDGYYQFHLTDPDDQLHNQVHFYQAKKLTLAASLKGKGVPLTTGSLLRTLLRHPLNASMTMPRILWQAARLYWQRKLPVNKKPVPQNTMTIRPVPPRQLDRLGSVLFKKFFGRLRQGKLNVRYPNGVEEIFGESNSSPQYQMNIKEHQFFGRVMVSGDIGFGESYTEGEWSSDDLPGLLTLLAKNQNDLDDKNLKVTKLGRWLNYLKHKLRANTLRGSARNIREHYDLSNEFFALLLDESMTYSSAIFKSKEDTLAQAQRNKLQSIINKADIGADDHVLEIGCGWGSFAIEVVRQTGCRVTGITLSTEQLKLAQDRVQKAGLCDKIDLKLCDYRKIEGQFTKIVSIEMLEAVGHVDLKTFFSSCDKALLPGGKAVVQVITICDRNYENYRKGSDWIRKHIFPGGHLPSVGTLAKEMGNSSNLIFGNLSQHGLDYARTLVHWRKTLLEKSEEIKALGYDDRFLRKWDYYFSYSYAGFMSKIIDLTQFEMQKHK